MGDALLFDAQLFFLNRLCGLTVERSLAILKVAGSTLGRSTSR